jgi:hypothetical protein
MRTRAFPVAAAAVALCALAGPVSAQIIATSIPKEFSPTTGKTVGEKKWAFHVMGAPLAKWKYGEAYFDLEDPFAGTVQATPNSDFLVAGEIAFKAGENWSIGIGGWYNKIGQTTFALDAIVFGDPDVDALTGDLAGDIKLYEGHASLFYKDLGVQGGIVKTSGRIGTTFALRTITFRGQPVNCLSVLSAEDCTSAVTTFQADTTDWDAFAVYKHSWGGSYPVGVSVGAGVYGKQGISSESPLRSSDNKTVFTGFATASIGVYKGLGVDASFWYIDKTDATERGQTAGTDTQTRLTVGLGYTFSK